MLGYCNCLCSPPAPNPTEQPTRSRSDFPRAVYPSSRENIFSERATQDSCPFRHGPRPPSTAQKGSMGRLRGLPARLARSTDGSVHQNPWPRAEKSVPPRKGPWESRNRAGDRTGGACGGRYIMLLAKQPLSAVRACHGRKSRKDHSILQRRSNLRAWRRRRSHPIGCECWRVFRMQPHALL